ncbi:unnamed protein product [Staurois parvus]|uniref:Uncharacterized protein n=1 Tax=Staurois parvus TaxID=386267 RepID=A0ABN9FWP2_9NEOB|nr:unnamed protein product [Staurois parvus]
MGPPVSPPKLKHTPQNTLPIWPPTDPRPSGDAQMPE